jgi:hypothetical protein
VRKIKPSNSGISRLTEKLLKGEDKDRKLTTSEQLLASVVGGALACWNQPIEVIRVEMQSQLKDPSKPTNLNIWTTAKYIYQKHGFVGFYKGVPPRIMLSVYLTVCMVFGGDQIKKKFAS